MEEKLKSIEKEAVEQLRSAEDLRALDSIRVKYMGKKGVLTEILRGMRDVPAEQRPAMGMLTNQVKESIVSELEFATARLKEKERMARLAAETIDITLPGRRPVLGRKHPLTQARSEIIRIFRGMGFQVAEGPEVEIDYYNFDALNMPEHHPARDDRDSM
jgi:phenylalanyl-tRNA synthetase alpha chain